MPKHVFSVVLCRGSWPFTSPLLIIGAAYAIAMIGPSACAQSWSAFHAPVNMSSAPAVAVETSSSPAALLEPEWTIEILYRGTNQHLWDTVDGATVNQGGYSNPVTLIGAADTTVWKGKVVVFYEGANQHLFIASKAMFQPQQAFNNPIDTGYGPLASAPSIGTLDGDHMDIFYKGANGHLWEMHFNDLMHWTAPEDLGGVALQSRPSVVSMRDQSNKMGYQVLYVGPNGHLWKSVWPSDLKNREWWSAPEDLGGDVITAGPVSINLPSAKGAKTDRGIQTFYLTDAPGTDRLRYSTWVGYDSKGNTDWWSGGNQIVIPGASFSADLGTAIFGVLGLELFYKDGQGHYARLNQNPAPPPTPPPSIALTASPNNGYVPKGQPITLSWNVTNCMGTCSVSLKGLWGIGWTQQLLSVNNLPIKSSLNTVPSQTSTNTKYVMTATGTNGTATEPLLIQLPPPTGPSCSGCMTYYFKLTNDSPTAAPSCFTQAVIAQSESAAEQLLQSANIAYTVSSIDAGDFLTACNN
jgi:hypothetical protein